jgi:hypothetical protein
MQAEIEDVRQSAALGFAQGGRIQAAQRDQRRSGGASVERSLA